jgi:hypothetical protein
MSHSTIILSHSTSPRRFYIVDLALQQRHTWPALGSPVGVKTVHLHQQSPRELAEPWLKLHCLCSVRNKHSSSRRNIIMML